MTTCGQFCPVSKAAEILFEKWTILILRDLQRGISRISPTLLTKRLKTLEENGVLVRKKISGQRGYEYFLTPAGKELKPLLEHVAIWGMRWARGQMSDDELDVELLMREIQRRLQTDKLPGGETVILFNFTDENLLQYKKWWVWITGDDVDLCTEDPGKDVALYIVTDVRTMIEVWQGDKGIEKCIRDNSIQAHGTRSLITTMPDWIGLSLYAGISAANK